MNYQYISVEREMNDAGAESAQMLRSERAVRNARRRRETVARQKRTLLFTAMALILGVILAFSVLDTDAQALGADQASEASFKYYKEVYVQTGDTLWTLAEQYTDGSVSEIRECISEIRSINDLGSLETLRAGTYIVIPYYTNSL